MNIYPTVLIVDDEKHTREGLKSLLQLHEYEVDTAAEPFRALEIVKRDMPDIVITDLRMPNMDGMELLDKIKKIAPETLVIVFTAYGTVENAVKAIQNGAFHYLTKPINTDELLEVFKKAVSRKKLEQENKELRSLLSEKSESEQLVYKSPQMREIIDIIGQVAPTNASVLINGESGTGKELVARLIHQLSNRSTEAFIPVHCASLTESLLASELFGHERGAFTGAVTRSIGRFERAHQGTLFLDEIAEIKEDMQVKLLRVLQNGEFERVGGTKIIKVDVRIVCATNKDLLEEIKKNHFREDLYYRLNVVSIKIPPLRDRKEDIHMLVDHYLKYYTKINNKPLMSLSDEAIDLMMKYNWPGNVRELKNVIERMVVLSRTEIIPGDKIPSDIRFYNNNVIVDKKQGVVLCSDTSIRDMEKELIRKTMYECKQNKSRVAKKLGISRRTLYRKLDEYSFIRE